MTEQLSASEKMYDFEAEILSQEERVRLATLFREVEESLHSPDNWRRFASDPRIEAVQDKHGLRQIGMIPYEIRQTLHFLEHPKETGKAAGYAVVVFNRVKEYLVEISEGELTMQDAETVAKTVREDLTRHMVKQAIEGKSVDDIL